MVWLPDDEKCLKICLFVLTESTNVTDRHRMTATSQLIRSNYDHDGTIALYTVFRKKGATDFFAVTFINIDGFS